MKKVISMLLSVVMLFSITAGLDLSAYADTSGDWEYEVLDDGTVAITGYNGTETNLTIPSVLDKYNVTSIGDHAFAHCHSLTSIIIPDSVTSIDEWAFWNCESLTNVTILEGVTLIGRSAFVNSGLTNVNIPESVITIGYNAFASCDNLKRIDVSEKNQSYSTRDGVLFDKNKTELIQCPIGNERTSYTIPDSVTTIGGYAFSGCDILTNVTIPDSVTTIGDHAFSSCDRLTNVTIPSSVTTISDWAFSWCVSLTNVTISVKRNSNK